MRTVVFAVLLSFLAPSFADDAFVDTKIGFAFPQTIAGFRFEKKHQYDDPKLGYALSYWSADGILISVFVYDLGTKDIEDGIASPRIQQAMKQAQDEVRSAVKNGLYRTARLIDAKSTSPNLYLRASYRIVRADGKEERSHLLFRGQRQHFLKVRGTGPDDQNIDKKVFVFAEQLSKLIGSNNQK